MARHPGKRCAPLPRYQRARLQTHVRERGATAVLAAAGDAVGRWTLSRALAGLPLTRASAAVLRTAIDRIDDDDVRARQFEEMARAQESR